MAGIKIGCVRTEVSPCYGCEDRNSVCHADCERYAEFVRRKQEMSRNVKKKIDNEFLVCKNIIKAKEKSIKQRRK